MAACELFELRGHSRVFHFGDYQTQGARAMTNILDLQRLPEINGLNLLDADQATCTVCSYTCCCTAAE
jgi:hypothetical protein